VSDKHGLRLRRRFEVVDQLLVFLRACAVKPRRKYGDNFQDVLRKVLLEARIFALVVCPARTLMPGDELQ
jgi:hypothetical protein